MIKRVDTNTVQPSQYGNGTAIEQGVPLSAFPEGASYVIDTSQYSDVWSKLIEGSIEDTADLFRTKSKHLDLFYSNFLLSLKLPEEPLKEISDLLSNKSGKFLEIANTATADIISLSNYMPLATPAVMRDIENYGDLEIDWDARDADRISKNSISAANAFIRLTKTLFDRLDSYPEPSGRVGLECRKGPNKRLYLSFSNRGDVSFVYVRKKEDGSENVQRGDDQPVDEGFLEQLEVLFRDKRETVAKTA